MYYIKYYKICNKFKYLTNNIKVNYGKVSAYIIMLNKPIKSVLIIAMSNIVITTNNTGRITLKNEG